VSDEPERERFFQGAVRGARQGQAKLLADLLVLLRDGYPRTSEDDSLLNEYLSELQTRKKSTPGRKPEPQLFSHTSDIRKLADEARRLQEIVQEPSIDWRQLSLSMRPRRDKCNEGIKAFALGKKLPNALAAKFVAGPAVARRNRQLAAEALRRGKTPPVNPSDKALKGEIEALARQILREMQRKKAVPVF
jgi:hypothetical protein